MAILDIERWNADKPSINVDEIVHCIKRTDISPLDLIVRECLQNSLDSALSGTNSGRPVRVDFFCQKFDGEKFLEFLGSKSKDVFLRFLSRKRIPMKLLAVRDSGTTGVDGDYEDDTSRVHKLMTGFLDGKTKESGESTLGGSHGAGKTVALKLGVGLVVYYTKTAANGESRLWAYYCQNGVGQIFDNGISNNKAKYLPKKLAWWGKLRAANDGSVMPTTDRWLIRDVLKALGLPEFKENESGTIMVIPFVDDNKLMKEIQNKYCRNSVDDTDAENLFQRLRPQSPIWQTTILKYLEHSVVKWYAPRLAILSDDPYSFTYPWGPLLQCSFTDGLNKYAINGADIDYAPYRLVQKLFKVAVDQNISDSSDRIGSEPYKITIDRGKNKWRGAKFDFTDENNLGALVVVKLTSPGEYDELFFGNDSDVSIVYTRSPGLILSYDDPDWSACLRKYPRLPGEKLFGVFVPNVKNWIRPDGHRQYKTTSFEVPFRESEGFDHGKWPKGAHWPEDDEDGDVAYKIIGHVIDRITSKINALAKELNDSQKEPATPSATIGALWGKFFGVNGAGVSGRRTNPGGNGGRNPRTRPKPGRIAARRHDTKLELFPPEYSLDDDGDILISVPYKLAFGRKRTSVMVSLTVRTGTKCLSYDEWQKDMEKKTTAEEFPAEYRRVEYENSISVNFSNGNSEACISYNGSDNDQGTLIYVLSRDVVCELKIDYEVKEVPVE